MKCKRWQCCCDCKLQLELVDIPSDPDAPKRYVCLAFGDEGKAVNNTAHGLCEMWTVRKKGHGSVNISNTHNSNERKKENNNR